MTCHRCRREIMAGEPCHSGDAGEPLCSGCHAVQRDRRRTEWLRTLDWADRDREEVIR